MSGGTPTRGCVRQRHSQGGYGSSSDDLEDDACSRPRQNYFFPTPPRPRSWMVIVENMVWIASAIFVVYYGDRHSNFVYLLWHDGRVRRCCLDYENRLMLGKFEIPMQSDLAELHCRMPLYFGMAGVGFNVLIFLYTSLFAWSVRRFDEKWELSSLSALPWVTVLGLLSFCLFCIALWPIWSFLTVPLLFTLFMAFMIILPSVIVGMLRQHGDAFRID
ncbi:hypothetical protein LINPERHAP1_LOCUS31026 [Linum perenne]